MDPAAKQTTRERIADLRAAGTTILMTTHELGDVERLADHVAVLDRGRIVAYGTPAELTGAGAPRVRFRLSAQLADADALALAEAATGGRVTTARVTQAGAGHQYELDGLAAAPDPALVARLAAWCEERGLLITELRVGAASLEERYLELVGADAATESKGSA
jgi:ABC-2 type transport system ATP-binding protein